MDEFQPLEELGRGGMGVVMKARNKLGRVAGHLSLLLFGQRQGRVQLIFFGGGVDGELFHLDP